MGNFFQNLKQQVGSVNVSPSLIQAAVIIVLVFLLILFMAKITRTYISWYTSGWYIWVALGFIGAIIVEGFFVVSGSTVFTSLLGWKGAPKPIQAVVDVGRARLIDVLGAQDAIPTESSVLSDFEVLDDSSQEKIKSSICTPDILTHE